MGRAAWLVAFAASLALHAALAIGFRDPSVAEFPTAASKPVSIAGSLSSVLGSSSLATEASVASVEAVRAMPMEQAPRRPSQTIGEVKPEPVPEPVPVPAPDVAATARTETARPVAPAQAEDAKTVEQAALAEPTEAAPATPETAREAPSRSSPSSQVPPLRQQRVTSASKRALRVFARKIVRALARSRPKRIAGTGKVVLAFTLAASGGLEALAVRKSSGDRKIDRAALRAVRRARFPKPPTGATRKQRSFLVPYHFRRR